LSAAAQHGSQTKAHGYGKLRERSPVTAQDEPDAQFYDTRSYAVRRVRSGFPVLTQLRLKDRLRTVLLVHRLVTSYAVIANSARADENQG
jgi:hypothetical protein